MKKLLYALALLALMLVLLPSEEAKADPIPVDCVYYVAGEYYLNKPQSVPESYDCHYQMDWWTYPVEFNQVVEIGGVSYLAANVDTMVYKKAFYVSKQTGTPATCTEPGVEDYWKCSQCGRMYSDKDAKNEIQEPVVINALKHDWGAWALDPDDATKHKHTCQRNDCGVSETHSIDWSEWAVDAADDTKHSRSCQADGCGATETHAISWSDWAKTDDQNHAHSCTADGCTVTEAEAHTGGTATCVAKAKCTVCGEEYGELGRHSPVADAAVEPTYTETGLTAGSHCRLCGAVLVEQEIVPMLVDPLLIAGEDVTGFVEYQGGIFLVEKGRVLTTANGLVNDPAQPAIWYFLSRGQAQLGYTGLAYYDGEWFYVRGGRLDTSLNAFVAYDGGLFLVAAGRVVREASGLIMNPDRSGWYYCANGQAQTQYTGLARYDGHWFYVVSGKLDAGFNGIVTYNGAQFRVAGGQMIEQVI